MKRRIVILSVCLVALLLFASSPDRLIASPPAVYTDDSYYWAMADTVIPAEPVYDRNAREFIFLEDTTQYPDTVRMRIVNR